MVAIISHRGGALLWPENSRAACANSVALGADQVQVDLHLTRDGRFAVIHDATLDRTTNASGEVAAQSWAELRRWRLNGTDESIPDLQEVIDILEPSAVVLRLEMKPDAAGHDNPELPARLQAVLRQASFLDRSIVTAFAPEPLEAVAAIAPGLRLAWLIDGATAQREGLSAIAARARRLGAASVGLRWSGVEREGAAVLRQAGLGLCCFGCNDSAGIEAAFALGADELMTDRPDLALRRRAERH